MNCNYCGTSNLADEHRCTRCGRKLSTASTPMANSYRSSALAYQKSADDDPHGSSVAVETRAKTSQPFSPGRQPALFQSVDKPRVVPIFGPHITPKPSVAPQVQQQPRRENLKRSARENQQQFSFGTGTSRRITEVESEIYCSAPVASTQHRVFAAFIDCGIVLTSFVLLAAIFFIWSGASIEANPVSLSIGGGVAFLVAVFYQTLWVLANGDTAGMRIAQLSLVNFDGRRPGREQRFLRVAAAWLSVTPGALGLFWALVDEEKLTWHDQISKTFPSPRK